MAAVQRLWPVVEGRLHLMPAEVEVGLHPLPADSEAERECSN